LTGEEANELKKQKQNNKTLSGSDPHFFVNTYGSSTAYFSAATPFTHSQPFDYSIG
jgi:hypothetical protein